MLQMGFRFDQKLAALSCHKCPEMGNLLHAEPVFKLLQGCLVIGICCLHPPPPRPVYDMAIMRHSCTVYICLTKNQLAYQGYFSNTDT